MIKKMWVKFDGMGVDCICDEHHRKCREEDCKEYVVKFTEIKREKRIPNLDKEEVNLGRAIKKLKSSETELLKSVRKFKGFKIK